MNRSPHSSRQRALSLVEVVLAIGIIAFAVVAILGLLAVGSDQFRTALDTTVCSQIAQHIINDAEQTDFLTLISDPTSGAKVKEKDPAASAAYTFKYPIRYFDEEGNEIIPKGATLTAQEQLRALYWVNVRVRPTAEVARPTTDKTLADPINPVLAQITVEIARKGGAFALEFQSVASLANLIKPRAGMPVYTYSALIGRNN